MFSIRGVALTAMFMAAAAARAAAPAPADTDYPGTIRLAVDATDLDHRVFRVRETIPVAAGPLTLFYPQWLPGNHGPRGPVDKLAGLAITAGGKPIPWSRDTSDVYAFHVDVPEGTTSLDLEFQFLSPQDPSQGRVVMTPEMLNLQWNTVVLYPAGHFSSRIAVAPSVKLPGGWKYATALDGAHESGGEIAFQPVSLETLVDSPMIAGRYYKQVELDPGAKAPVRLDIIADEAKDLDYTEAQMKPHRELVQQAYRLFGSRHYDHYDFLFTLSGQLSHNGL